LTKAKGKGGKEKRHGQKRWWGPERGTVWGEHSHITIQIKRHAKRGEKKSWACCLFVREIEK